MGHPGRVQHGPGFCPRQGGTTQRSRRHTLASLEVLFQEHERSRELTFLGCLDGILARADNNLELAEGHFRTCIEALEGSSSSVWLAETYCELGVLYRQFHQTDRATEAFKSADAPPAPPAWRARWAAICKNWRRWTRSNYSGSGWKIYPFRARVWKIAPVFRAWWPPCGSVRRRGRRAPGVGATRPARGEYCVAWRSYR